MTLDSPTPAAFEFSGMSPADRLGAARAALDGANLLLLVVGPDHRILDANAVARRQLGYGKDQLRFCYLGDVDPEFDITVRDRIWPSLLAGDPVRESRVLRARDGSLFPAEVSFCLMEHEAEQRLLVLGRDISDHLIIEAGRRTALDRRERCASLLAELAVHPGVVSGDVETLAEWLLEGARELLDLTVASLWLVQDDGAVLAPFRVAARTRLGQEPQPFLMADVATYIENLGQGEILAVEDVLGDPRTNELYRRRVLQHRSGATLDAPLCVAGELFGVLCFEQRDRPRRWTQEDQAFARSLAQIAAQALLTRERHRHLDDLRRSEQRLALAQEAAGLGSWELEVSTRQVWWSEHLYTLFGIDSRVFPASLETFMDLVHPDERLRIRRWHAELLNVDGISSIDYRVCKPSGEVRSFRETALVERDGDGRPVKVVGSALDVTDRLAQQARIEELAYFDELTGLPNRRLLGDRVDRLIRESAHNRSGFALVILDLDHFKQVNDSLGHSRGDAVLQEVGLRLQAAIGPQDTLSRTGGDEFAIVLPGISDPESLVGVTARITDVLRAAVPVAGHEIPVAASLGVSCFPQDGRDLETLLRNADTAMYEAKSSGRNAVHFYQPAMNERAVKRLAIEAGLRRAIDNEELELHFQPVFNVVDGRLYGAEALLRWRDPERGLVPPGDFLPVAEECGLIIPIGEWVMDAACRQARSWQRSGFGHVPVLVNLSAVQLQRSDIVKLTSDALSRHGLDPDRLCLEITESTLMERMDNVIPMLRRLRAMGVRIAIDDFGTGYSSLSYLTQLPLHVLKIDRSFIQAADREHHVAVITRTLIQMARDLGLLVVAEGVETQSQLDWLRVHGCNAYQGFFRSAALPADEFDQSVMRMAITLEG